MGEEENIRDVILRFIREAQIELKACEAALYAYDHSEIANKREREVRFYNVKPVYATRRLLREIGYALSQEQLTMLLMAGGVALGKKRGIHNIRIGIEMTLKNGTLKQVGELLGLPEWEDSMFVVKP